MQPQLAPSNPSRVALRCGASVGVLLGLIHSMITIVSTIQGANSEGGITASSALFYLTTPLIWIIGLLVAGAWSSKTTGKVSTGTLAGLFAGLFGGIVAGFGQAIASAIGVTLMPGSENANLVLLTGFFAIFYVLILTIGAGSGLGALGGLIGQSISNVRQQVVPQPHPVPPIPVYQPPYGYMPQQIPPTPQPRFQEQFIQQAEQ